MIPFILLFFFIDSCHGLADFNSRARNISIGLVYYVNSDHVIIAPFTVWSLMAAAALGTSGNSSKEISRALLLPKNNTEFLTNYSILKKKNFGEKSDGVDLDFGSFIFINEDLSILSLFRETMVTYFGATIKVLDFGYPNTARIANTYIQLIHPNTKRVFKQNDFKDATMIINNVIYFNGKWKSPFNASHTKEKIHYKKNISYRENVMHQRLKLPYSNMDSMNANITELAFGDDDKFCLLLIIPNRDTDIKEVYRKFNHVSLKDVFDKLQSDVNKFGLRDIDLSLPSFRIKSSVLLNEPLNYFGIFDSFEPESDNFRGITKEGIYISSVEQRAVISCTESGVIASATTIGLDYNYIPELETEQPFIFFIVEKSTQTILFGGFYSKTGLDDTL
ncbi:ovalbumin-related protein X-like [Vanessa atalanta]|uniref:ovalbumin-related protein X-like n=1 Tax=Vanessa atalanta TaxID=42275 RepID=UPI001FCD5669|nr:ovalbumin-related protein X-like [Vanessa atalanta]